ncbi:hypothetical protein [Nonomuraea sp. PA05]|nr:hypothetical protein [Nonomuraea sp. PA05]
MHKSDVGGVRLDLNPVVVGPGGALTVDARIRSAPCQPPPSPLLRHLC